MVTTDPAPIIDPTDRSIPTDETLTRGLTPTKPPKPLSAFRRFLQERAIEIIVLAIFVPLLSWGGCQLYTLNREMGEMRSDIQNAKGQRTNLQSQIDKLEGRFTQQIDYVSSYVDSVERRIDALIGARLESQPQAGTDKQN